MSDTGTSPFISFVFFNHPTSIKWFVSWTVRNGLLKPLCGKMLDWLNFRLGEIIGLIHGLEKRYYQNKTQLHYNFGSVDDCFKWEFIALKIDIISIANITLLRTAWWRYAPVTQCYVTCGHTNFITATSYGKKRFIPTDTAYFQMFGKKSITGRNSKIWRFFCFFFCCCFFFLLSFFSLPVLCSTAHYL